MSFDKYGDLKLIHTLNGHPPDKTLYVFYQPPSIGGLSLTIFNNNTTNPMPQKEPTIKGKAFVLGKNIDTDQIIPAAHLVYSLEDPEERKLYGKYALSGVPDEESGLPQGNIPLTKEDETESEFNIIVGGPNFGCGSSREHAPACLEIAGVKAIIAPTFARIFYRNSVDGGFIIPYESLEDLSQKVHTHDELEIDQEKQVVKNLTQNEEYKIRPLGSVADIVSAGGIFAYARKTGMMKPSGS